MATTWAGGQNIASKYGRRGPQIDLPDKQWPSRWVTKSPIWMLIDLRDGNQALPNPMFSNSQLCQIDTNWYCCRTKAQKWRMVKLLVAIGFKQIEVWFWHGRLCQFSP